ncbi:M14 family metallopeptidase [uncultured Desulfosarcina sp.]|uniref:M14 family metallopeptidase n=1 Tax=uncultured Desulfosarcina sp. TaxID=218289 RepID=UPI0029C7CAB3|nr:M14 family metallopeptidase [uncultured Desulfosarcina sp.]
MWAAIGNLSARLTMHVTSVTGPIASLSRAASSTCIVVERPRKQHPRAASIEPCNPCGWRLCGNSAKAMARVLESLSLAAIHPTEKYPERIVLNQASDTHARVTGRDADTPVFVNLCSISSRAQDPSGMEPSVDLLHFKESILIAPSGRPRDSRLLLGLEFPSRLPARLGIALTNLVSRSAAEATDLMLPLAWVGDRPFDGIMLKVVLNPDAKAAELKVLPNSRVLAIGNGSRLVRLLEETGRLWFEDQGPGSESISSWLDRVGEAACIANGIGSRGSLAHRLSNHPQRRLPPVAPAGSRQLIKACEAIGIEPPIKTARPRIETRRLRWPGEVERLLAEAKSVPSGTGRIECTAFLSKPANERRSFAHRLKALLSGKGYHPGIKVYNAYKPGVDWLLNEIAPSLPETACRVLITFQPFAGKHPNQLELKSRWAQEIFPAPDLLALNKGWPVERVEMSMDPEQQAAYRLTAWDRQGREVFTRDFTPPTSCFSYIAAPPEGGTVNPTCIGLKLSRDGQVFWEAYLPSDREVFWRRFLDRWLPQIERRMIEQLPEMLKGSKLAFWQEVRIEVAISETEERLGLDEERLSPMEALHEDLYFGLLDFMKAFCLKHCPQSLLQLGRIVPVMHAHCPEKPWARLRLRPIKEDAGAIKQPPVSKHLSWSKGKLGVRLEAGSPEMSDEAGARLCQVAKAWGLDLKRLADGEFLFRDRPARRIPPGKVTPPSEPLDQEKIPSADQIRRWTRDLDGFDHLHVWRAGNSLHGRGILAVEASIPASASVGKARHLKPTLLVNARHHANEVSGSNAALSLAWRLAATSQGHEMLKKVNVVIVPLENADGVATLEELLPEAPDHKLHAARYNALGVEWYAHYFDDNTPFPEARVKTRLFRRWLPEYILDLHGVPSHEWEQPFAGYLNPHFRAHWIPRAFVYAILPFYGAVDHPGARESKALADDLLTTMAGQADIDRRNKRIYARYHRYAAAFEPDVFTAAMCGSMAVEPTSQRIAKTNFGNRFWPLVKSEVITEVLDEVVQGAWLERCARAHQVVAWTMLERMARGCAAVLHREESAAGVRFVWLRRGSNPGGSTR